MATMQEVSSQLADRAAQYGGTLADMLERTPVSLWDSPTELQMFWEDRDLSHIFPQSTVPELANEWSNIIAEDSSVNQARGAEDMTAGEIAMAEFDNQLDAQSIDNLVDDDHFDHFETLLDMMIV